MKRSWLIGAAWLLLLIPTLVIGGVALNLLQHEQQRIEGTAEAAAGDRTTVIAESIEVTVTEVQEGLSESLRRFPAASLRQSLEAWKRENALVRNVFVWDERQGLLFPDPGQPGNDEEAAFVSRYGGLFAGRAEWSPARPDASAGHETGTWESAYASRRELRQLAKSAPGIALEVQGDTESGEAAQGGWLPWFWEDRLHLLGWVEQPAEGLRYGVELEMMALLARLVPAWPSTGPEQESYALVDGNGRVFHQSGGRPIDASSVRVAAISTSPALPHWQVVAYVPAAGFAEGGGQGFLLVSSLLVVAVVAAILFGGSLLLWQAFSHQRDARRKTSFVSNVSHELKTPLTTIRMYAELLAEGSIADGEKRGNYLKVIADESRRLTRLVNNVLDFSRLEQGGKQYCCEQFDLSFWLQQTLDAQVVRLQQEGMTLVQDIPASPLAVRADRDALEQVLLNLLDNALKYAGEGGRLEVALVQEGGRCRLRVMDRGPGVPAAHRKRIFDKFHRVDDSLTARRQGSGLGLSIARELLRGMGGELRYCARDGGGACFEVLLDVKE